MSESKDVSIVEKAGVSYPATYVPKRLRREESPMRDLAYSVQVGFPEPTAGLYGPFDTLEGALETAFDTDPTRNGSAEHYIVRHNCNNTDTILYRWANGAWQLICPVEDL